MLGRSVTGIVLSMMLVGMICTTTIHAVPMMMNYQGVVEVDGQRLTGTGYFRFALLDSAGSIICWSNDGLYPPQADIPLTVTEGLFNVVLGDPDVMQAMDVSMFTVDDIHLRIWFHDGDPLNLQVLSPDQPVASSMFAVKAQVSEHADTADYADDSDEVDGHDYDSNWPTTRANIRDACNDDFHQIGGVDDDIPDTNEVSTDAIQDDAVDGSKLAHNIDAVSIGFNADQVDGEDYSSTWPTTLDTVKAACSNNFHNIGGTDDDQPDSDSEVPNDIST